MNTCVIPAKAGIHALATQDLSPSYEGDPSSKDEGGGIIAYMLNQTLLVVNIIFVFFVLFLVRRILKAASVFKWNPGDNEIQFKQKLIILKTIVITAFITLLAAILNAYFG